MSPRLSRVGAHGVGRKVAQMCAAWSSGSLSSVYNNYIFKVAASSSRWVITGERDAYYSTNGTSWTSATIDTGNFYLCFYGNGYFIAVTKDGAVYTSPTGATWTYQTIVYANNLLLAGTYGHGKHLLCAYYSPSSKMFSYYSTDDGATWSFGTGISGNIKPTHLVSTDTGYVLLANDDGAGGVTKCYSSTDGSAWTAQTTPGNVNNGAWTAMAAIGDTVVVAVQDAVIAGKWYAKVSTDQGGTWSTNDLPDATNGWQITVAGGKFVCTTSDGYYVQSSTGETWSSKCAINGFSGLSSTWITAGSDDRILVADYSQSFVASIV